MEIVEKDINRKNPPCRKWNSMRRERKRMKMSYHEETGVAVMDEPDTKTKRQPPYNVILMNDDDHTVQYVVTLCQKIFGFPVEKGMKVAKEVHNKGRCILWTGALEVAELKQEQIHEMGADPQIPTSKGSMTAVLEPAA